MVTVNELESQNIASIWILLPTCRYILRYLNASRPMNLQNDFFYILLQVHKSSKSRQKKTPRRCHTTATKICWQHQVTRFGNLEITSEPQSELKTAIVYAPTLSLWSKNELILRRIMRKVCGHGLKDGTIWLKKVFTIISISCSFYYYLCSPLIVKYLGTNCSD